jgi:hypothetical protein
MGKTKYLRAFEWYGITGLFVSRSATLLGSSISTVYFVYQLWSNTSFSQLDTTVASIGINMGQKPCGTLSTPCPCPDELRLF